MKKYYCVTTTFDDRGRVTACITGTVESECKPDQIYRATRTKDIYVDYFGTFEEAVEYVNEAKLA